MITKRWNQGLKRPNKKKDIKNNGNFKKKNLRRNPAPAKHLNSFGLGLTSSTLPCNGLQKGCLNVITFWNKTDTMFS